MVLGQSFFRHSESASINRRRLLHFGIVALVRSSAASDEQTKSLELGRPLELPIGGTLLWKTETRMTNGVFFGHINGKPGESSVVSEERRTMRWKLTADNQWTVFLEQGELVREETHLGRASKEIVPNPLLGTTAIGKQSEGTWSFALSEGRPSISQTNELRRLESIVLGKSLLPNRKIRVGESFAIDGTSFLKSLGYGGIKKTAGTVSGRVTDFTETSPDPCVHVRLDFDISAAREDEGSLKSSLIIKGTADLSHSLQSGLDRTVKMRSKLITSGQMLNGPGNFAPFRFETDLSANSSKDITP